MRASALTAAIEQRAFAATRRPQSLAAFHVPFERLTGRSGAIERLLEDAIDRGMRVLLVGESGSGKSSLVSSAFDLPPELAKRYAPVSIGLGGVSAVETLGDPRELALMAIGNLAATYLDEDDAEVLYAAGVPSVSITRRSEALRTQLGGRLAGISKEVRQAIENYRFNRSPEEVIAALATGVDALRQRELTPVLLLDDADSLLGLAQVLGSDGQAFVEHFFARGLSPILAEVQAAAVIAAQPAYRAFPSFETFRGNLVQHVIEVPAPSEFDEEGVPLLITHAIRAVGLMGGPRQLFDDAAMTTLTKLRYKLTTVRELISICEHAVMNADAAGRELVTEPDVAYGVTQARAPARRP